MSTTSRRTKNNGPFRIIAVDSESRDYEELARWVVAHGGQIHILTTGRAALRQGHQPAADLYLINVRLPDFSGYDLVEMLRPFPSDAAVFLVADEYAPEDEIRALRLGVRGYLCKPLEPSLLCERCIGKEVIGHETFVRREVDL